MWRELKPRRKVRSFDGTVSTYLVPSNNQSQKFEIYCTHNIFIDLRHAKGDIQQIKLLILIMKLRDENAFSNLEEKTFLLYEFFPLQIILSKTNQLPPQD